MSHDSGGHHNSKVKERILLHSQLLLVTSYYLAGQNQRRIKQDHKYQRCFRGESKDNQDRQKRVRMEIEPESEAAGGH